MWRVPLAVALALVIEARPADACGCAYEPPVIAPRDLDTDVPLNARITVRTRYTYGATIELRDPTGAAVPLIPTPVPDLASFIERELLFATPASVLAPNTTYTVVVREEHRPEVTTTFTTGFVEDHAPPVFAGLASLTPETMTYPLNGCYSSCVSAASGHLSRIRLGYPELPPDVVFAAVSVWGDDGKVDERPLSTWKPELLGFEACGTGSPILEPGARYCARLVVYDVAGNAAGASTEVCATAQICPPRAMYPGDGCTPSDGCSADEGYDPFTTVDPDPPPAEGGCAASTPGGLAAVAMTMMSWICAGRGRRRRLGA